MKYVFTRIVMFSVYVDSKRLFIRIYGFPVCPELRVAPDYGSTLSGSSELFINRVLEPIETAFSSAQALTEME